MHNNNQSENLIERAVKTTVKTFHDLGLIDSYDNSKEVLKYCHFIELKERGRLD